MKLRPLHLLLLTLLLGGCATPDVSPAKPAASAAPKPTAPVAAVAPQPVMPAFTAPVMASPKPPTPAALAPEVKAVVVHLTDTEQTDTLAHDIVDTTGFPEAIASLAPGAQAPKVEAVDTRGQPPARGLTADGDSIGLIERDWTGLVLVPINKSLSKAYTTSVRLLKVEAHPLKDGRIRVWIRMQNIGHKQLPSEIACTFSMKDDTHPMSPNFYELEVPSREYRDVFFVSPVGELNTYTVLIRSNHIN
jgi:hypothetical protein